MAEAAIGTVSSAPTAPSGDGGPISADSLVDSALSAMEADGFLSKLEATPEELAAQAEPADGDGELEPAIEEESDDEPVSTKGAKDDPFTEKDLPEDKYVRIKVDGVEEVVSLKEALKAGIRQSTFHRGVNEAKSAVEQAEGIARRAVEQQSTLRDNINRFLGDPDQLVEFFLADDKREAILEKAARRYATLVAAERQDPTKRIQRLRARDSESIAARERALAERETKDRTERQQRETVATRQAELKPGWEAGIREAGFPKVTPELQEYVRAYLVVASQRSGKPATADDMRQAVIKAAKVTGSAPAAATPPKAPKLAAKPAKHARNAAGQFQKGSVDWFMSTLNKR